MLSYMRKHQKSFMIYLLFGIIIVVFVAYFGPQSAGCFTTQVYAAKVNGEIVTEDEFNFTHSNRFRMLQEQDRTFNRDSAARMKLREQVMDQLVNTRLLAQEARRRGLRVSDEELRKSIMEMPMFRPEGKFDEELYERTISNFFKTSLEAFEERHKTILLAQKMLDTLTAAVQVSGTDAKAKFEMENDKANLYFIRIDPEKLKPLLKSEPSEVADLLKNFYKDVEDYYNKHIHQYKTQEQVRARHILAKVDENASPPKTDAEARGKIESVQDELNKGGDFAELAKKSSDCPSAKQGGDLGFFGRGQMDKAFEEATFALEPGQTSGIVKSAFGYHLIKIEEKKPASEKPIKEAEGEIAEKVVLDKKAGEQARKKAGELFAKLQAGAKITDLAPAASPPPELGKPFEPKAVEKNSEDPFGLKVEETGGFGKGGIGYIPKIGINEELLREALALTAEKPNGNKVFEINNRFFLVSLKDRQKPDMAKFEAEKAQIIETLRMEKSSRVLEDWLGQRRKSSMVEINQEHLVYRGD